MGAFPGIFSFAPAEAGPHRYHRCYHQDLRYRRTPGQGGKVPSAGGIYAVSSLPSETETGSYIPISKGLLHDPLEGWMDEPGFILKAIPSVHLQALNRIDL
jgi:hypothetical protein